MSNPEKDPFAGFAELRRRMEGVLRSYREIGEQVRRVYIDSGFVSDLTEVARQFVKNNEALLRDLAPAAKQFAEVGRRIVEFGRLTEGLDRCGWLPHVSTPLHLVQQYAGEPDRLSQEIEQYYRDNWSQVRCELEARVDSYALDQEAKDSFREGLAAHGGGQYRAVCRHLFPEIERVARVELHNGNLGAITSQKELQALAGKLLLGEMEPHGLFAFKLFQRLTDHLYVKVNDEATLKLLENDPVPNRHAAVHGLVVYRSFKNSLNTIFMTDYVFHLVHLIKQRAATRVTD